MTTRPSLEGQLAAAMRSEAEAAMNATDTGLQFERLTDRLDRASTRRTRWVAVAVAACVVAVLVIGLTLERRSVLSEPADRPDRPAPTVQLDEIRAPAVPITVRPAFAGSAPTVLDGLYALGAESPRHPDGPMWLLSTDDRERSWSLDRLSADRSKVELQVPLPVRGVSDVTSTADVVVLAVKKKNGGPSGLLRLDRATGQILGFTASTVKGQQFANVDAAADGTVWAVVSPGEVSQIQPRTGRILRTLPTPVDSVTSVLVLDDTLWLYPADVGTVAYQVDRRSGDLVRMIRSTHALHVRVAGGIILMHDEGGRLERVEPDGRTRAVQLQLPTSGRVQLAGADDQDLWLTHGTSLLQVDGRTLAIKGNVTIPWYSDESTNAASNFRGVVHEGDSWLVPDWTTKTVRRVPDSALRID